MCDRTERKDFYGQIIWHRRDPWCGQRRLDARLAFQVGMAAAYVMAEAKGGGQPRFTIGKDTRISSDLLEGALVAGLCSAGADVLHLGVIPTPAVAWITVDAKADAGIVISASHNPFEHNGIKIFDHRGFKLSDALEGKIEEIVLSRTAVPLKTHGEIGRVIYADEKEAQDYIDYLVSTVDTDLSGLHILVDCANGAASATAARLFDRFPDLHTDVIHADPDGVNINHGCGSTHLDSLRAMVKAGGYDLGIAFDGDADRCLMVDETGEEIDGDQVIASCGLALKQEGKLPGNALVATVMSNMGLRVFCRENGIDLYCTDVGDRNVLEKMEACGYMLGGEQSGHTIFRKYATTGDGQLTALQFLSLLHKSGKRASELVARLPALSSGAHQCPCGRPGAEERDYGRPSIRDAVTAQEDAMAGTGRVLVRPSGTESLIRVMVEAQSEGDARNAAEALANIIKIYG